MPCTKCRSDFNVFNWKIKCGECDDKYCSKCLRKRDGILYCEKCMVLLKRPPDRVKLMELKPKDLQDYLSKHNISTYGLVEKQELVDLFCDKHIQERPKRGVEKLTANFPGSVPNIRQLNDFFGNLESVFPQEQPSRAGNAPTPPSRSTRQAPPPPPPRPHIPKPTAPPPPSAPPRPPPAAPPPSASPDPPAASPTIPTPPSDPQPTTSYSSQQTEGGLNDEESPKPSPAGRLCPKLSDFTSASELGSLSAKGLKQLLALNRVDYKGCVEKGELLERAERLWNDNYEHKKDLSENVEDLCKLCMDAPLDCVLLECGHIATCIDCGKKLAECPICRQYVSRVVRTFKA